MASSDDRSAWKWVALVGAAFVAGIAVSKSEKLEELGKKLLRKVKRKLYGSINKKPLGRNDSDQYVPTEIRRTLESSDQLRRASHSFSSGMNAGDHNSTSGVELVQDCKPPFPYELVLLLESTCLCYLSTQLPEEKNELKYPHLSLMNFTYYNPEEVIIMTTRRDTQKLENLRLNPSVAILVHDFPAAREIVTNRTRTQSRQRSGSDGSAAEEKEQFALASGQSYARTSSITLYGRMRILDRKRDPELAEEQERYRVIHRERNEKYKNFIDGENIAVLLFDVEFARICNIHDQVHSWRRDAPSSDGGGSPSSSYNPAA
ncbi:unnamed protein product [Amoebophrya sp. A120]|nr:unnamed protein product [Amoebophrya sp. A120]|eukprot:GSA120T00023353001.1